jgi:translocation and assembly module TamB
VAGTIAVTSGRVERVSYQRLAGRFDYDDRQFSIDLRLDQSPGVWITAVGQVPLALFDRGLPAGRLDVSMKSSGISLGLMEGVTDAVRHVSGELHVDVKAVGTSDDPRFIGSVAITQAAFQVTATSSTYKNARAAITLTEDRVTVEALHIEDAGGRPLEVRGSLGTQSLRVSDLEITAEATGFEIFRNEFGRMEVNARLHAQGRFQSPRITGDITIHSGNLNVDEILARTAFEPYATEPAAPGEGDPFTALNRSLWELLGMDLTLHVPNSLRLTGENVQISPGTPIGIGNVNLRVAGDLYFYKDPGEQLYVTGSLDSISGTYSFQGRRFDVNPNSSIVFRGELNPELYLGVTRVISGVEVRVGVIGPVRQPELRLASTPPLDASEILSLIVFNTQTNQLTAAQQQDLVVRAGTLAAGFVATPLVSALETKVGLEILDIEPGDYLAQAPKVTVGEEIAPGLVARFSRQFGSEPYDEATVEYYLARILRLRATFSDAQSYNARSPFRRVERAGIDLLFFFSF